jgi:hypothetical protein
LQLPEGGIVETLKLNALNKLSMVNLTMLETIEIDEGIYDANNGMNDLKVKNCPAMDPYTYRMALEALMTKYELTDFNWTITSINDLEVENGKVVGIKVVDKLVEKLPGSGAKNTSLIGNIHIDVECNIDEYDIYKKYCQIYPNLTITYGEIEGLNPAVEVKFMSNDTADSSVHYRVLGSGEVTGSSIEVLISAEGPTGIAMADPSKKDTSEFTYDFSGYWKNVANNKLYYRDGLENPGGDAISFTAIIPTIDMVFVPVFIEEIRKHEVKFHDYSGNVIETAYIPYGSTYAAYEEGKMTNFYPMTDKAMLDKLPDSERYGFRGWSTAKFEVGEGKNMEYFDLENEIVKRAMNLYPYYERESVYEVATSEEYFEVRNNAINIKEKYRNSLRGKITLPNMVGATAVGDFSNMPEITHVYFLNNSTQYREYRDNAFNTCGKLKKINTPLSIVEIKNSAFNMCSSLEEFNFHNNITSIGPAAFAYCSNLKMDELPANLKELGPGSFRSCSNITVTKIPKDLEVLGSFSFVFCPKVKIAVFGSNDGSSKLKTIGQ